MKLIIPQMGAPEGVDARLVWLAEFLGIVCEPLFLERGAQNPAEYIERAIPDRNCCFLVNPQVIRQWTGNTVPDSLACCLTSRFPHLLVHALTTDAFCQDLIKTLSGGRLRAIQSITDGGRFYDMPSDSGEICGPFAGLSVGPVDAANDCVLAAEGGDLELRTLVAIGGRPHAAMTKGDKTEIVFLAGADVVDLDREMWDHPLSEYFSRFVTHAMALRYIFGEESWRPGRHYASFTVDDPLLRPNYGFLNFETLLRLMEEHNLCTTIGFIPHNYRKNSRRVVRMFRKNPRRLAICFHGNDHTEAELASSDIARLNTMLGVAEARMDCHRQATGLNCPKVMVFPKESYSVEAMRVLKCRSFSAGACTRPNPLRERPVVTLRDLAQPAVLRHGAFALFLRKYVGEMKAEDVAFNLFFGRPILIVDHHQLFGHPDALIETVGMVNSVAADIRWSDLETAVASSSLKRRMPDGTYQIRAFSGTVGIANDSGCVQRFLVEWRHDAECPPVEEVLQAGKPIARFEISNSAIRVSLELAPRSSQTLSVVYRNEYPSLDGLGLGWRTTAFIRRRLSEVRDNYISKSRVAASLAQRFNRRVLSKVL